MLVCGCLWPEKRHLACPHREIFLCSVRDCDLSSLAGNMLSHLIFSSSEAGSPASRGCQLQPLFCTFSFPMVTRAPATARTTRAPSTVTGPWMVMPSPSRMRTASEDRNMDAGAILACAWQGSHLLGGACQAILECDILPSLTYEHTASAE